MFWLQKISFKQIRIFNTTYILLILLLFTIIIVDRNVFQLYIYQTPGWMEKSFSSIVQPQSTWLIQSPQTDHNTNHVLWKIRTFDYFRYMGRRRTHYVNNIYFSRIITTMTTKRCGQLSHIFFDSPEIGRRQPKDQIHVDCCMQLCSCKLSLFTVDLSHGPLRIKCWEDPTDQIVRWSVVSVSPTDN